MKYEPYHALINAIILQAVKDYRTALDDENTSGVVECERFFRSDWFTFLTDVDGEIIIQTVSKERLSTFIKSCTTKELKNIDNALLVSLGINSPLSVGGGIEENAPQKSTPTEVERDLYKTLYEQILDKLVGGNTND